MTRWQVAILFLGFFCLTSLFILYSLVSDLKIIANQQVPPPHDSTQLISSLFTGSDSSDLAETQSTTTTTASTGPWYLNIPVGKCNPLLAECDEAWRHWLLDGNITFVKDPPECCRPWHAFDMF